MTTSEAIDKLTHAKKWSLDADFIKALEMAIKALEAQPSTEIVPIGTKVRVTQRLYDHWFLVGEKVIINKFNDKNRTHPYLCEKENGLKQWLSREEFELV